MTRWLEDLGADVRYGIRQIARAPVFTIVAVVVLALGIGVNSALFSFIDTLLVRPFPGIADQRGIVRIAFWRGSFDLASYAEYVEFRERQTVFEGVATSLNDQVVLDLGGTPAPAHARFVTGGFFQTVRPRMALGTGLARFAERAAAEPVVVLGYGLWRSRLGGAADVIGRIIRVNRVPMTVVGVMGAAYPDRSPLWIPLAARASLVRDSAAAGLAELSGRLVGTMIGRLRAGATVEQARAQANAIVAGLDAHPSWGPIDGVAVAPLRLGTPEAVMRGAPLFANVTLLILLIVCANVGVLLLGRAVARRREISVRLALGAARRRVIRQLVTEGVLLALLASVLGLFVLDRLGGVIRARFADTIAMTLEPSWRTVALTLGFAAATGILFALLPALHATRVSVSDALKDAVAGPDRRSARMQRTFVVVEVALSMALVCATGIFVQATRSASGANRGFDASPRVLAVEIEPGMVGYSGAGTATLLARARERIGGLPGVASVSTAHAIPGQSVWSIAGMPAAGRDSVGSAAADRLLVALGGAGIFGTLGIPLVRGRDFDEGDAAGAPAVAIIDETLARTRWPGQNPLGRTLAFERNVRSAGPARTTVRYDVRVVGVVGAVMQRQRLWRGLPVVYLPRAQVSDSGGTVIVVRGAAESAAALAPLVRQEVARIDPDLPIRSVKTLEQRHAEQFAEIYDVGLAATLAGLLALALACVGVYAVIVFGLAQRTREVGIRCALGARPRDVVLLFFRDGMRLTMIGFAIGVPLGLAAMKLGRWQAFGVEMLTPRTVASVVGLLLVVAVLASWLPARRATAIDPLDALRQE